MSEGPGQQPPQEPREVLEGLVIPSRRRPQPPQDADPRRQYISQAPEQPGPPGPQAQTWGSPPQAPGARQAAGPAGPGGPGPGQGQAAGPGPQGGRPGGGARQGGPAQGSPYGAQAQGPQGPGGGSAGPAAAPQAPFGGPFPGPGAGAGAGVRAGAGRSAGPAAGPGTTASVPDPGTPDWGALADQQEASGARRRKIMMLVGGLVAVAVIAGGVATAVVLSGKSSGTAAAGPTGAAGTASADVTTSLPPEPSFSSVAPPPPANPLDYLSTAAKDKAPVTVASLFPGKQFLWDGRTYVKTRTSATKSCASAARGPLAPALSAHGCREVVRATYTSGTMAVTIGIAVFDDAAHAAKVKHDAQYIAPLNGGGIRDYCHAVSCQMTSNAAGRYAYFAIAGPKNGATVTAATAGTAATAADDASNFAFNRIIQRGKDAAAADPNRS